MKLTNIQQTALDWHAEKCFGDACKSGETTLDKKDEYLNAHKQTILGSEHREAMIGNIIGMYQRRVEGRDEAQFKSFIDSLEAANKRNLKSGHIGRGYISDSN